MKIKNLINIQNNFKIIFQIKFSLKMNDMKHKIFFQNLDAINK